MVIHHDKGVYGKRQKTSEELSEEQISKMLNELREEPEKEREEDERQRNKGGSDIKQRRNV